MNRRNLYILGMAIVLILILTLLTSGGAHLFSVPRQYLFRLAIGNTIGLAIPTTAVVVLLGAVSARFVQRFSRRGQIVQRVLLAGLSIGLFVPSVTMAVRKVLQSTGLLDSAIGGLVAIGGYYVLILLPVVYPLLTSPKRGEGLSRGNRSIRVSEQTERPLSVPSLIWGGLGWGKTSANQSIWPPTLFTASISILFILLNPITPLLLTGGGPYNRTYLWSAFAFHTAYVSHAYGQAAAMIVWMLPLLLILVGTVLWAVKRL